jgi:hypothetical protein
MESKKVQIYITITLLLDWIVSLNIQKSFYKTKSDKYFPLLIWEKCTGSRFPSQQQIINSESTDNYFDWIRIYLKLIIYFKWSIFPLTLYYWRKKNNLLRFVYRSLLYFTHPLVISKLNYWLGFQDPLKMTRS